MSRDGQILRVVSYNIHKGVQGLGPARRLEIHNLALAIEQFDADIVCLQEVRKHHRRPPAAPGGRSTRIRGGETARFLLTAV